MEEGWRKWLMEEGGRRKGGRDGRGSREGERVHGVRKRREEGRVGGREGG